MGIHENSRLRAVIDQIEKLTDEERAELRAHIFKANKPLTVSGDDLEKRKRIARRLADSPAMTEEEEAERDSIRHSMQAWRT